MESVETQIPILSCKRCQKSNRIHFVHEEVENHGRVFNKTGTVSRQRNSPIIMPAGCESSDHAVACDKINSGSGSLWHCTEQGACEVWPALSDVEPFPMDLSSDTRKELIPDGVMSIGDCVKSMRVIDLLQSDKPYLEVVVVEVFTPSFFWVQLCDKLEEFDKFMKDLHHFYNSNHIQYKIPSIVLKEGLNCACIYDGAWHRGVIEAVKPDQLVTVMFYDYGTVKTYPADAICYLHEKFSYLPTQAIPCGLANIRPYEGFKWTHDASHNFTLKVMDIPLIAIIASINTEDNSIIITLTDTSREEDEHINDWLVDRGNARHGKTIYEIDMSNIIQYEEEELLITPHKCCEAENEDGTTEETMDVPLITPESTLRSTVPTNSFKDQGMEDQLEWPKSSENGDIDPSLRNKQMNRQRRFQSGQTSLSRVWHENMKLQKQISNILGLLLNGIDTNPVIQGNNKVNIDRDILIAVKMFFHYLADKPLHLNGPPARAIRQTNLFKYNPNFKPKF